MWRNQYAALSVMAGILLSATVGCGMNLFPLVEVEVPETPQYVLDNTGDFIADASDALESTEPGTVTDDLATLDGCWGSVFTEADVASQLSLYSVYQFDAAETMYVCWTFIGRRDTGELWPLLPLLSEVTGTYEVTGADTIEMTVTRIRANASSNGAVFMATLEEVPIGGQMLTRTALITLDGDEMLLFIDAESAADVNAEDERPIYIKFDCPE